MNDQSQAGIIVLPARPTLAWFSQELNQSPRGTERWPCSRSSTIVQRSRNRLQVIMDQDDYPCNKPKEGGIGPLPLEGTR